MTLNEINEIIASITYKPNFKIFPMDRSAADDMFNSCIVMTVPDRTTKLPGQIVSRFEINPNTPADAKDFVIEMIYGLIRSLELHECAEQFRVNGELIYDPHKD